MTSERKFVGKRTGAIFLVGTILGGWSVPVLAQAQQTDPLAAQPASEQPAPEQPAVTTLATPEQGPQSALPFSVIIGLEGNRAVG